VGGAVPGWELLRGTVTFTSSGVFPPHARRGVALHIPVLLDCRKPFPPYDNKHVPRHRLSRLWTD
jgi:hypothetical protein